MTTTVRVETPSRLQFGFLDPAGHSARRFVGLGCAIDEPRLILEARPSEDVQVDVSSAGDRVDGEMVRRLRSYAEMACRDVGREGVEIRLLEAIPRHVGLGSGTQAAMAVADATTRLEGTRSSGGGAGHEDRMLALASEMGRGRRSGVGCAAYLGGGFVVDSGKVEGGGVPRVAVRRRLPVDWRFVVVTGGSESPSGSVEDEMMSRLADAPRPADADEARRLLLGRVLPGVAESDPALFGEGLREIGMLNGGWYERAGVQDGVYADEALLQELESTEGVYAAGQSSWGPSVYALTTADEADDVSTSFGGSFVARPDPVGAVVRYLDRW